MTTDDRDFAHKLFNPTQPDPATEAADATKGNHVPSEGNHVPREGDGNGTTRDTEHADRNFAGALFGVTENARNLRTTNIY